MIENLERIINEGLDRYVSELKMAYNTDYSYELILDEDETTWKLKVEVKAEGLKPFTPFYVYAYKKSSSLEKLYESFLYYCVSNNLRTWHDMKIEGSEKSDAENEYPIDKKYKPGR